MATGPCIPPIAPQMAQDGRRLVIIKDAEPSSLRPYYEEKAYKCVYLKPSQLCKVAPPPGSAHEEQWPLDARFECALARKVMCVCNAPPQAEANGKAAGPKGKGGKGKGKAATSGSMPAPW